MKTLALLLTVLCFNTYATQKVFSPRKTFPFEGRGYKIQGVPKNVIYLTIDDGPTPVGTPAMLKVLEKHGVKATFFVHGVQAKRRPHLLREMYQAGHLIANHSYVHQTDFPTRHDFHASLMDTHELISPYIGSSNILLYRAPGGVWNDWRARVGNSHSVLKRYVGPLFWNVGGGTPNRQDDADWKCWRRGNGVTVRSCTNSYYNQVLANYRKGQASLILLHDVKDLSARLVDGLINKLKRDGVNWEFRLADDMPIIEEYAFGLF